MQYLTPPSHLHQISISSHKYNHQILWKKLGNTKNIVIEVLAKICAAMSCTLDNIVEMVPEDNWR